jgi:hypothetical protein
MNKVTIIAEAETELREAVNFYELKGSGLGLDFLHEVESGLELVKTWPNLWPVRRDGTIDS